MLHDPNDPEYLEALKYLALPSDEKIKLRSQPFDAKKACWVPDPKESYIAADIESTKDDQVTVKTCKGEVRLIPYDHSPFRTFVAHPGKNRQKRCRSTDESTEILLLG
jgi:hypothetical protein